MPTRHTACGDQRIPAHRCSRRALASATARRKKWSARGGGARSRLGRHRNAPSRSGERWLARAGHGESGMVQLLRARGPMHPPLGGSPAPSATATALQRRSTLPGSARRRSCGSGPCAMASPARSIHRSATALSTPAQSRRLIKKTENAYPRPRDRRLSRKTRAAVGKPPGSTTVGMLSAVLTAPAQTLRQSAIAKIPRHPLLLQTTGSWSSIGPVQFPHWLSQPG